MITTEDLQAIAGYLPNVLVSGTAQHASQTLEQLNGILERIDAELEWRKKEAEEKASAEKK